MTRNCLDIEKNTCKGFKTRNMAHPRNSEHVMVNMSVNDRIYNHLGEWCLSVPSRDYLGYVHGSRRACPAWMPFSVFPVFPAFPYRHPGRHKMEEGSEHKPAHTHCSLFLTSSLLLWFPHHGGLYLELPPNWNARNVITATEIELRRYPCMFMFMLCLYSIHVRFCCVYMLAMHVYVYIVFI